MPTSTTSVAQSAENSQPSVNTNGPSPSIIPLQPLALDNDQRFGRWIDSSNDFLIVRQHGELNKRVLYMYQSKLHTLERALEDMDIAVARECGHTYEHGFLLDEGSPREKLLERIAHVCKEYNDHLMSFQAVQSQTPATARQVSNVLNWLKSHAGGSREEAYVANHADDMISFEDRPRSAAQRLAEHYSLDWFYTKATSTDATRRYDDIRLIRFKALATFAFSLVLLITPIWSMFYIEDLLSRFGYITGFLVLSWTLMSFVTTWRSVKIMSICAAYLSILLLGLMTVIFHDVYREVATVRQVELARQSGEVQVTNT